jgi:hypothetical protein
MYVQTTIFADMLMFFDGKPWNCRCIRPCSGSWSSLPRVPSGPKTNQLLRTAPVRRASLPSAAEGLAGTAGGDAGLSRPWTSRGCRGGGAVPRPLDPYFLQREEEQSTASFWMVTGAWDLPRASGKTAGRRWGPACPWFMQKVSPPRPGLVQLAGDHATQRAAATGHPGRPGAGPEIQDRGQAVSTRHTSIITLWLPNFHGSTAIGQHNAFTAKSPLRRTSKADANGHQKGCPAGTPPLMTVAAHWTAPVATSRRSASRHQRHGSCKNARVIPRRRSRSVSESSVVHEDGGVATLSGEKRLVTLGQTGNRGGAQKPGGQRHPSHIKDYRRSPALRRRCVF